MTPCREHGDQPAAQPASSQRRCAFAHCACCLAATERKQACLLQGTEESDLAAWLSTLGLRYFSPQEVAALHSFPASFSFPPGTPRRQQYALLGNSLSVLVVATLLQHLLQSG